MIPAVTPTRSRPIENYPQQIFRQSYGLNPHATSAANRNFFHEINPAVMIPAVTPTRSRPIVNYPQQIFRQSYGPNPHAKSAVNRNLLHEINSAVMIPATNSTHPRLNGNYSQQIFMQPYGSKHHVKSAANRNFLREINHVVIISAAKSQTCNISIQFTGSCNQSANFINKRSHDHANDSPHYSQHHQLYLINSEHGDNPSQERLNSVATSSLPSLTENAMQQAPIWKASSSLFTQVERLKAMGIPKTSKYSDTHTPMGLCSLRTFVSLYAHYGPVYPSMLTTDPCIPHMLTPDLCTPRCPLRTCMSLYAHYGPVYPSMLTTVISNSVPKVRTLPTTQHLTTSLPTGGHNPTSTPTSSTPQTQPILPNDHLHPMPQYDLPITRHGTVISHIHSLELRLLHTIQCTLFPPIVYSNPLPQFLPPDLHNPAKNDSQPKPLYITNNNYNTNDIPHDTQPVDNHIYHANDSPHNNNPHNISPAVRYSNRPAQDSASQTEHSSARKQPSNCCENSSHKLTATAHSANAHIDSSRTRDLKDPTADCSLSSHRLTLSSQYTDKRPKAKVSGHTGPAARYFNRPGQDSAFQAEHSSARKQLRTCCETSSHKLTATAHIDSNKRPKAKASDHTGNPLPHNRVPNVRTASPTHHHTTSMHTGAHNPSVTLASSTLPPLATMPNEHPHSMPQYDLHLTIHGTALSHPQSLEFHLLHTIQCTLSPIVVYYIPGPPDDPLAQFLPPDFHTPAIQEYVRLLCRPLVLFLDQAASSSLMDMEDQLQPQHQPPSHVTNLIGRHHAHWTLISPTGCLRHCPTTQQYSSTHCPRTEDAVAAISPCFFHPSTNLTIILCHHNNQLFHAVSTQTSIHPQRWKREQMYLPTPTPPQRHPIASLSRSMLPPQPPRSLSLLICPYPR